jgi:hypothetical protein
VNYGFVCRCEACGLPDHLSDARDAKLKVAADLSDFLWAVCAEKTPLKGETDVRRALQGVETLLSFRTQERAFNNRDLILPVILFSFFGLARPMQEVGEVVLPTLMRFWGPGHGFYSAKNLCRFLKDPGFIRWGAYKRSSEHVSLAGFDKLIQKTVSSVISSLRNLA